MDYNEDMFKTDLDLESLENEENSYNWDVSRLSEEEKEKAENLRKRGNVKTTTVIKEDVQHSIKSNYVLAFTENLEIFADMDITKNQLRVCTYMLTKMEYGNLVTLNQTGIAKHLKINKSTISRVFKQLKEKKILIEDEDGNTFINSNLFVKGIPHRLDKEKRGWLNSARDETVFTDSYKNPKRSNK